MNDRKKCSKGLMDYHIQGHNQGHHPDNLSGRISDDILYTILSFVSVKSCQRIDKKSAREWFPVSSILEEECRKKRIFRCQKKYFRRTRNRLDKKWQDVLESSDPLDAQQEWRQCHQNLERDYTNFILTTKKECVKKEKNKQLYHDDFFYSFFEI